MKIPKIKLRHWMILVAFFAFSFWWFKDVRYLANSFGYALEGNTFGVSFAKEMVFYSTQPQTYHVITIYRFEKFPLYQNTLISHKIVEFRPEIIFYSP